MLTLAACTRATPASQPSPSPTPDPTPTPEPVYQLGARVLPLRPDGFGEIQPTPPELRDRRLATADLLPPPSDDAFHGSVNEVPADVVARSTWRRGCPVGVEDLRYLRLAFWGFDGRPHTGEMIVHASVADDVQGVFRRLHELRFPIEEMRVVDAPELDAPPTGDGNNTTGFTCRPVTGGSSWSQHAYGRAVDVNPFHNPYLVPARGLVLPELASAYTDRDWVRPGMVTPEVVAVFDGIGWGWGGRWSATKDWMHFSESGR